MSLNVAEWASSADFGIEQSQFPIIDEVNGRSAEIHSQAASPEGPWGYWVDGLDGLSAARLGGI